MELIKVGITEHIELGQVQPDLADKYAADLGIKPSEVPFIRKGIIVKGKTDDDERSSTETINTDDVDRDNEILLPRGAVLNHYKQNPQVLWAHDYQQPPIGRAAWIKKVLAKPASIMAKTIYAETDFAEEIWTLVKDGFLPARSVGFIPLESHEPDEKELVKHPEWQGVRRIYDKWELLEYSVVPVPSNRQALQAAMSKDLSISDQLAKDLGVDAEEEISKSPEPRIVIPTRVPVRLVQLAPRIREISKAIKKPLDIREVVATMVHDELDRIRGRI